MCVSTTFFERHWSKLVSLSLFTFGPLMVAGNTLAQMVGFNPIELISNPQQKYDLLLLFICYFVPFLPGALFLGLAFLRAQAVFGKVYFADLVASGLCGLIFLAAMYAAAPEWIVMVPLALWLAGALVWFGAAGRCRRACVVIAILAAGVGVGDEPTTRRSTSTSSRASATRGNSRTASASTAIAGRSATSRSSPAPISISRRASPTTRRPSCPRCRRTPISASSSTADGPIGIIKKLPDSLKGYFQFLPMYMPYVLKQNPEVFVVQLGGGISTEVARTTGARKITVAEGNPAILRPCAIPRSSPTSRASRSTIRASRSSTTTAASTPHAERQIRHHRSLARGFDRAFVAGRLRHRREVQLHARDARRLHERAGALGHPLDHALEQGGPAQGGAEIPRDGHRRCARACATATRRLEKFFIVHTYLSTATILYKKDGFSDAEAEALAKHANEMSFELLYRPGMTFDMADEDAIYAGYRGSYFHSGDETEAEGEEAAPEKEKPKEKTEAKPGETKPAETKPGDGESAKRAAPKLSWANLYKVMIARYLKGEFAKVQQRYVFDTRPLTNERPYFAGYIKASTSRNSCTSSTRCRTSGAISCCGRRWSSPSYSASS